MALFKRDDSPFYHFEVYLGGERRAWGSTEHTDRRKAEEFVAAKRAELRRARDLRLVPLTLGEACSRYWDAYVVTRADSVLSQAATRSMLKRICAYFDAKHGRDLQLISMTAADIAGFKAWLIAPQRRPGGGTWTRKPSSADRLLNLLHAILARAKMEWNSLLTVPPVVLFREDDTEINVVEPDEEARLLACANAELRDLIQFCLYTGARRSEALRLQWSQVVFSDNPQAPTSVAFVKGKTNKRRGTMPRTVPVPSHVDTMLRRRHGARTSNQVFAYDPQTLKTTASRSGSRGGRGRPARSSPLSGGELHGVTERSDGSFEVYIKVGGKKRHLDLVRDREHARAIRVAAEREHFGDGSESGLIASWRLARQLAGIQRRLRLHDLRHSYATRLIRAGVNLVQVQRLMGHQNILTTMRYVHLAPSAEGDAIRLLDAKFQPGAPDGGRTA